MNNKSEPEELQDQYVEVAQNCRFENMPGAVVKREPICYFNTAAIDGNPIMSLYRYYTSGGITKFIATSGTGIYVGDDATGTWTLIRTVTTTGKRFKFVTYKDILIGSDNITWELCSAKAKIGPAGSITRTAISYAITWDDDWYVPGAVSNTIAIVTAQNISLSNIPLGPIGTVNRKIYRKSSETGGGYRLIATLANNTSTTYTDTTADASAGTLMPGVTDSMPRGAELQIYRERLFITRDPTAPNTIYYSDPYTPWYIQKDTQLMYLEISPDDNDEIMGIPIVMGNIVCIKKNTIRKVFILGPTGNWYAEDPFSFSGSPAAYSICQTPMGIVYLGWDHWYLYDGSNAQPVIDEFDTGEILPANYYDVVSHWDNSEFLAAYTDLSYGSQVHDRVMRYNFKRKTLSYDTIFANCFASKRGDQETGELYYGASNNGFVYQAVNEDINYRLTTKTDALTGTLSNVFVGGTENNPYMEIGTIATAVDIPQNICIFWDSEDTNPGVGWTEISSPNNFIKISATQGTIHAGTGHTHGLAGNTSTGPGSEGRPDDNQPSGSNPSHYHPFSITSGSTIAEPKHLRYRLFYKNATVTGEGEFPVGAIVMYDQTAVPEGWEMVDAEGYYIKLQTTDLGYPYPADHTHSYSGNTSAENTGPTSSDGGAATFAGIGHTHSISGTTDTANLDSWELDYVSFRFIRRIGEEGTWDGTAKYAYALYYTAGTPGNGWVDQSATYEGRFLRIGTGAPAVGAASNAAHTHTFSVSATGSSGANQGSGSPDGHAAVDHTHSIASTASASGSAVVPPSITFRLFRKELGKMKDYNAEWETPSLTAGTWTSPAAQLSPELFKSLWWNEALGAGSDMLVYIRVGATQALCLAAAWQPIAGFTNPNSQSLVGIPVGSWVQVKVEFSRTLITDSNPKLYSANGFLLKFSYSKGAIMAEAAVEFVYDMGFRHFDAPAIDKIFQKLASRHEGSLGSFAVYWETENASGTFNISLLSNSNRWDSFFPSNAFGREIKLKFYKNDLYSFKLKELQGFYAAQPLII
jgi:hypothetical protein